MLRNYLKIALRSLWRNRLFTALNVLGLSIGLSAGWVIYRIVNYEFSFDVRLPQQERIFRVGSRFGERLNHPNSPGTPKALLEAVRRQTTGLEVAVPIYKTWVPHLSIPQKKGPPVKFRGIRDAVATDETYFQLVPHQWLAGSATQALNAPNRVVLTQSRASRYFPGLSPAQVLGRTMVCGTQAVQVTGVVADLMYPSTFSGQEFYSIPTFYSLNLASEWGNLSSSDQLFLRLSLQTDPRRVESRLNELIQQNSPNRFQLSFVLQPLAETHFIGEFNDFSSRQANKNVLLGLVGLAGFILLLACINYINLATAQAPQRAREIGIRKTLGSRRRTLLGQFLGETLLLTLLALGLAFGLTRILLTRFQDLLPVGTEAYLNFPQALLFLLGLVLVITGLAGGYPGWLIARYRPASVLRGQLVIPVGSNHRFTLRKGLIVFQFFTAQVFIVGALFIHQQLRFSLEKDMGFDREAVLTLDLPEEDDTETRYRQQRRYLILKQEFHSLPGVSAASLGELPAMQGSSASTLEYAGKKGKIELETESKWVDSDLISLYRMSLLAGRNLISSDTVREYVLNESATKAFGFTRPRDAIGAFLKNTNGQAIPVVGVVRDFHTGPVNQKIPPLVLLTNKFAASTLHLRLSSRDPAEWQATIDQMHSIWKKFYPEEPFDPQFYDQTIAQFYQSERVLSRLVNLATSVAILLSCLGLFGLATLSAFQRTKEIGIRKVLGASVSSVIRLLSGDFLTLVFIAILLASPLAWYLIEQWLHQFAYRIEIDWWVFVQAGLLALGLALLTVSAQTLTAALANPVDSLRSD